MLPELLDQLERLLRQPAGVDREHSNARVDRVGHVDQGHITFLERGRDRQRVAEVVERPGEHVLRLLSLELDRQLARFQVVE